MDDEMVMQSDAIDGQSAIDSSDVDSKHKRTIDDLGMTPFIKKVTFLCLGSSFLDGYDLSLIGVALTQIKPMFDLDAVWSGLIGASVMTGILFGTVAGGFITDVLGRKKMLIIDLIAVGTIAVLSALVTTPAELLVARLFLGFFVGADYPIATSMIAEFSPKKKRAFTMGLVSTSWYVGATAAAIVGYCLYPVEGGWRFMLASGVIPAVILLIGRSHIPESPMWLAQKGRIKEATEIMHEHFGPDVEVQYEDPSEKTSLGKILKQSGYRKRIIFVGLLILCQVVPMYAIYTFGPDIMTAFGMGAGRESILGESLVSAFFLAGSIPAMFWLNTLGRRKELIGSLVIMTIGMLVLGFWPSAPIVVVILSFGIYAFFAGGPGILQWLYPNELFPTQVRASATGVAIGISRIGTIVGVYGTPTMLEVFGVGPTMLVGAGLTIALLILSIFMAPETKGKSLIESSSLD